MTPILELTPERKIRIWPEFAALPIEIELPRARVLAVVVMALICLIASGIFGIYMWLAPMLLAGSVAPLLISFAVTLAVLLVGWRAMRQYVIRDALTISREGVEVIFRGVFRDTRLHWPLTQCRGLRRREVRLTGKGGDEVRYTLIEIIHISGEPAPVIVERGIYGLTDELYQLSDLLGLDIITE